MTEPTASTGRSAGDPTSDRGAALAHAVRFGDEAAFGELADRYRPELRARCRRMLGSAEDAEDVVQEALLRAWRSRASFRGSSSVRTWLDRIATNLCLDELKRRQRQAAHVHGAGEVSGGPERALERVAAADPAPDAALVARETIELALLAALEHLPPGQRSVLVLRAGLGCSAKEAAALLDASVASVNSSLQRARRTLRDRLPEQRLEWAPGSSPSVEDRARLEGYLGAIEHGEADAFLDGLRAEPRHGVVAELRRPRGAGRPGSVER